MAVTTSLTARYVVIDKLKSLLRDTFGEGKFTIDVRFPPPKFLGRTFLLLTPAQISEDYVEVSAPRALNEVSALNYLLP